MEDASTALNELLNGGIDSATVTAQLDALILTYQLQMTKYSHAAAQVKDRYASIVKEATAEAGKIYVAAEVLAENIKKDAFEYAGVIKRTAEEDAEKASVHCKALVDAATSEAATILATIEKERELLEFEKVSAAKQAKESAEKAAMECQDLLNAATASAGAIHSAVEEERVAWETEKAFVANIQKFESIVKINVGGSKFTTTLTTLRRFPDSMIGAMYSGRHELVQDGEGYHFIDRDGTHFRYILNFLRSPETFECELTGSALKELKGECDYYGILDLMFPSFQPIPPFPAQNAQNAQVTVIQGADRIYKVSYIPVRICDVCGGGDYSVFFVPGSTVANFCFIEHFSKLVKDRNGVIDTAQPKVVTPCRMCKK